MESYVYLVVQHGVYRYNFCGVYLSKEEAGKAAIHRIMKEHDDYHAFVVWKLPVGRPVDDGEYDMEVRRTDVHDEIIVEIFPKDWEVL